jgi:hypothetical protein
MIVNGETVMGQVLGMSENGYLMMKKEGGFVEINQASEIKILRLS